MRNEVMFNLSLISISKKFIYIWFNKDIIESKSCCHLENIDQ